MDSIKCPSCSNFARIHPQYGVIACEECASKPSRKGTPINLTEGSERIKNQREQFHDDYLQPHVYNKSSRRLQINEEFLNKYPDKAHLYYTPEEMKGAGFPKLVVYNEEVKRSQGQQKEKIEAYKQRMIESHQDP